MAIWLRAREKFADNRFELLFIYSGTSVIRAVWDQGVPATLKLPVTLNLIMNYVRTVHGYMKTLVTST